MTDIKVPTLGESVSEATVNRWLKAKGDTVQRDEALVELETDKVTVEIPSPEAGTLSEIIAGEGKNVAVGDIIATITPGSGAADKGSGAADKGSGAAAKEAPAAEPAAAPAAKEAPAAAAPAAAPAAKAAPAAAPAPAPAGVKAGPATRREAEQKGIDIAKATPSAAHNITTKEDLANVSAASAAPAAAPVPASAPAEGDVRVRMSRLRKKVGERLKAAQNTAAILTTFNEINMQRVMDLRARHQESFQKAYGTKLGFMSFFIKASAVALKNWPAVNAEIDGEEIVYHNRYDIGIAVGAPMGLVVPTLRNADRKTFSELESDVADFGKRAREGKLTLDELSGGTFSITNGGIFGSLMSTPILNPPQSAILGLHKIQMRPIAVDGKVEIAPMMNVALSYDHRLVDGREAVSFLVDIKNYIEDPSKLLLG